MTPKATVLSLSFFLVSLFFYWVVDSTGICISHADGGVMQVDFLMSGLMVLKERIDATEALIAIDLDNRRNELVAFDLVRLKAHHSAT